MGDPPATILDLGSGDGYGAYALATALPGSRLLGIDHDPKAVEEASRKYAAPNLTFRCADPMDWRRSAGDEVWETIVCFEVLEHVSHRELLLEGVVASLAEEGVFLFSTPSAHPENVLKPDWEHHRIEYCASSLFDLLRRYFDVVVGRDMQGFPAEGVFDRLVARNVDYAPIMNPVLCRTPIRIQNPYR